MENSHAYEPEWIRQRHRASQSNHELHAMELFENCPMAGLAHQSFGCQQLYGAVQDVFPMLGRHTAKRPLGAWQRNRRFGYVMEESLIGSVLIVRIFEKLNRCVGRPMDSGVWRLVARAMPWIN